jgi:hypothetical protein
MRMTRVGDVEQRGGEGTCRLMATAELLLRREAMEGMAVDAEDVNTDDADFTSDTAAAVSCIAARLACQWCGCISDIEFRVDAQHTLSVNTARRLLSHDASATSL